ncbi:hypothetical protein Q1695_005405 [Nippostrongylus brasiliensis]|nr:hypothetical protein Q1695_005405 [Nippostrongylus brasiliensis]
MTKAIALLVFIWSICSQYSASTGEAPSLADEVKAFAGKRYWEDEEIAMCESAVYLLNEFCYAYVHNYQSLKIEVLERDPIIVIFRDFISKAQLSDLLVDIRKTNFTPTEIIVHEKQAPPDDNYRVTNGSWFDHEETRSFSAIFRTAKAMIPSINFDMSEQWQVLSYQRGGHFAPHSDTYGKDYVGTDDMRIQDQKHGIRFATFLLLLQRAQRGGGTVFPLLDFTVHPSPGDVLFWTSIDGDGRMTEGTIHGGCPVWEGEKLALVLWIRAKNQDLLASSLPNGSLDVKKLVRPRREFMGMTRIAGESLSSPL